MSPTAIVDHTALITLLYRADHFLTGRYNKASRGAGRIRIPSLPLLAAERHIPGSGAHAASLRFAEQVPFTSMHALEARPWRFPSHLRSGLLREARLRGDR
ncbi:hypothetical protein E4K10_47330 [Streptomyces sp. T1317-0309]|nr:hypothetical protein E4K10_47330 [Streptomyces sp. T1317-0309]